MNRKGKKVTKSSDKRLLETIEPHPDGYIGFDFLSLVRRYSGAYNIGVLWSATTECNRHIPRIKFLNLTNINDRKLFQCIDDWKRDVPLDAHLAINGFNIEGVNGVLSLVTNNTGIKMNRVVSVQGKVIQVMMPRMKVKTRRVITQLQYLSRMKTKHQPQVLPDNNTRVYNFEQS